MAFHRRFKVTLAGLSHGRTDRHAGRQQRPADQPPDVHGSNGVVVRLQDARLADQNVVVAALDGDGLQRVERSRAGIEAGIKSTVSLQPGEVLARHPVGRREVSAHVDAPVGVALDDEHARRRCVDRFDVAGDATHETRVGRAVLVQAHDVVGGPAVDGAESAADQDLAVGLDGDGEGAGVEVRVEGGVQRPVGVEAGQLGGFAVVDAVEAPGHEHLAVGQPGLRIDLFGQTENDVVRRQVGVVRGIDGPNTVQLDQMVVGLVIVLGEQATGDQGAFPAVALQRQESRDLGVGTASTGIEVHIQAAVRVDHGDVLRQGAVRREPAEQASDKDPRVPGADVGAGQGGFKGQGVNGGIDATEEDGYVQGRDGRARRVEDVRARRRVNHPGDGAIQVESTEEAGVATRDEFLLVVGRVHAQAQGEHRDVAHPADKGGVYTAWSLRLHSRRRQTGQEERCGKQPTAEGRPGDTDRGGTEAWERGSKTHHGRKRRDSSGPCKLQISEKCVREAGKDALVVAGETDG